VRTCTFATGNEADSGDSGGGGENRSNSETVHSATLAAGRRDEPVE
jgi:hypothetical protein